MADKTDRRPGIIILAAGASSRMGIPKAILSIHGDPLLELHLRFYRARGLSPRLVVLGAGQNRLQRELDLTGARVVQNPAWPDGQFSSIRAGFDAWLAETGATSGSGWLFLTPVDCPPVPPVVLETLWSAARDSRQPAAVVPTCEGLPGHPVLLGPDAVRAALAAPSDATLETVLQTLGARVLRIDVPSADILWNLNRPEDLERYLNSGPRAWLTPHATVG